MSEKEQVILKLLANSNAFKDRDNTIWPKETILVKIQKNILAVIS